MSTTEIVALAWVGAIAAIDLWLYLSGRETISRMMTRLGLGRWWVPAVYVAAVTYLFFHFWPWFLETGR